MECAHCWQWRRPCLVCNGSSFGVRSTYACDISKRTYVKCIKQARQCVVFFSRSDSFITQSFLIAVCDIGDVGACALASLLHHMPLLQLLSVSGSHHIASHHIIFTDVSAGNDITAVGAVHLMCGASACPLLTAGTMKFDGVSPCTNTFYAERA